MNFRLRCLRTHSPLFYHVVDKPPSIFSTGASTYGGPQRTWCKWRIDCRETTSLIDKQRLQSKNNIPQYRDVCSLRTADIFPVVASLSQKIFFGGREATTGNTSAVRRLARPWIAVVNRVPVYTCIIFVVVFLATLVKVLTDQPDSGLLYSTYAVILSDVLNLYI